MVFSFFKKPPEKMPERPAARPRPLAPDPSLAPSVAPPLSVAPDASPSLESPSVMPPGVTSVAPDSVAPGVADSPVSRLPDLDFDIPGEGGAYPPTGSVEIETGEGQDARQSDIEQVVVLFANGQDGVARTLLEHLIRQYPCDEGLPFWRLLFDLLQTLGDRSAFDALGVEFAHACETSPPAWRETLPDRVLPAAAGKTIALQGVLTAADSRLLDMLADLVRDRAEAVVDFSRLAGCDDAVAARLAALLIQARHQSGRLTLTGCDAFIARLDERLPAGQPTHEGAWLLLLELLQRLSTQERFETRAIDYAVTFERSPPSWEVQAAPPAVPSAVSMDAGVFYLSGEILQSRFEDLAAWLATQETPVLDFAGVRRLDFYSAGRLVNCLAAARLAGRQITLRSAHPLVAELLALVGAPAQARIIPSKS